MTVPEILSALRADPKLEAATRVALAQLDAERPIPLPVDGVRSARTRRIFEALQHGPLTPDELHARLPDVQRTSLIGAVHALHDRGYLEIIPTRYALVRDPRPITSSQARASRTPRTPLAHLVADSLLPEDRARLGVESDMSIAKRLGYDRRQIRDLRIMLGIAPVRRSWRPDERA